ncbi:MAG: DUF3870 domain-containing protein [Peptococcaceae bacterium]
MGNTVFFAGKARPSEGLTAEKLYGVLTIGLEVDMEKGVILDADCTLSTEVAKKFFKKIVVGYSLEKGIDQLLKILADRYHGDVGRTLGAALKNIYREYLCHKSKETKLS